MGLGSTISYVTKQRFNLDQYMRRVWLLILMLLPSRLKIELLRLQGHQISRKSKIGFSWLDVEEISMGDGSRIGLLNIFKGLRKLDLGPNAGIGRFNQFTANQYYVTIAGQDHGIVELANGAVITNRHYFDCQSTIRLDQFVLVAGLGSVFFTHQKGIKALHEAKPIYIGPKVYLGAACVVLPGASVAGYAYVVSGSLVGGNLNQEYAVYSSPRAQVVKELPRDAAYFNAGDPTAVFDMDARASDRV